jgi:hypothetical protein
MQPWEKKREEIREEEKRKEKGRKKKKEKIGYKKEIYYIYLRNFES